MTIYLNAASHGLPSRATLETFSSHICSEIEQGTVRAAQMAREDAGAVRRTASQVLGAAVERTVLGTTTTQAWLSLVARLPLQGKRVLVAPHEWGVYLRHLQHLAAISGTAITIVPEEEAFDPAAWAQRLDEDVAAVFMPLVTSIEALRYPVAGVGALPRPERTLLIVDAAQALGRVPVSMADLGCDALLGTARKWLRGPRATAVMALSAKAEGVIAATARELEPLDFNLAARCALGTALGEIPDNGVGAIAQRIAALEDHLRCRLAAGSAATPLRQLTRPAGCGKAPGNVVVTVPISQRSEIDRGLQAVGFVGKWVNPGIDEPCSRLAGDAENAFLRITPHIYNSEGEIDRAVEILGRARPLMRFPV